MIYPGISTIDVLDYNKNFIFQIYRLTEKDVNNVEPAFKGSILTIPMPIDIKRRKTYFRFRIFVSDTSPITKEDRPSNSWLESALLVTETIDFHVNEERNLSEDLLRTIHAEDKITFSKIHLYLMRYDYFDHVFSHPLPIDTRTLEENVWTDYLGAEYNCNRILAYHWRYKEDLSTKVGDKNNANSNTLPSIGFDKFNVFAKFRFQNANKVTILIFLAVLLAIGIAGSLIANIIWSLITH